MTLCTTVKMTLYQCHLIIGITSSLLQLPDFVKQNTLALYDCFEHEKFPIK